MVLLNRRIYLNGNLQSGGQETQEFEGGIYHGRIQLPSEYPFKPPSFMLLTPNGRFETQIKICLSISNHHPEHWQPSWSVRTALVALIAFMPTSPNGALGSFSLLLLQTFQNKRLAYAVKESTLDSLITELLLWLLDERVPQMDDGSQLLRALNVLMLKILVEIQVRKLYCVNKAFPILPINIEDAARSEAEIQKALQAGEQLVHVNQDTLLIYRVLGLRTPAMQMLKMAREI